MLKIGSKVKVIGGADGTLDPAYVGKKGVITSIETGGGQFPCGETETAPRYIVQLSRDDPGNVVQLLRDATDSFWGEELQELPA